MSEKQILLIRFSEIGIKSKKTRSWLTSILIKHIDFCLKYFGIEQFTIINKYSRIYVETNELKKAEKIIINFIPGVKSTSKTIKSSASIEKIKDTIEKYFIKEILNYESFAVRVKRVGTHSFSSIELAAEIGAFIIESSADNKLKVDLTNPDYTLFIEVREKESYLFSESKEGLGGLPVGCQGEVLVVSEGKKEDLVVLLQMHQRGAKTAVYSLIEQNKYDQNALKFIELLLDLQNKKGKEKRIFFPKPEEDVVEQLIDYYEKSNSKAIVMSKNLFERYEEKIPVIIPVFVPNLAEEINTDKLERIFNFIE